VTVGAQRASVEVVVIGGGPAGAATAALLAAGGHEAVVVERAPAYSWRACGVFASPAAVDALRRIGLPEDTIGAATRSIPAMRVEAPSAPPFRLTYGDDGSLRAPAVGFDRSVLDPALLDLATVCGARVRPGVMCTSVRTLPTGPVVTLRDGSGTSDVRARLVVGADGIRSIVARSLGVAAPARIGRRIGLTFHVAVPPRPGASPPDARMVVLRDGYIGLAPVPGDRVNVGIVLGRSWRRALASDGANRVARRVLGEADPTGTLADADPTDRIAGASPIGHRVTRRSGPGWLLVGDAAGFLDPFTGEGLHRALVSAELAATAIDGFLREERGALDRYERAVRAQFATKDVVSLVVQAFLSRPRLFAYAARRLASRDDVRETMGRVMGDLVPASRALDPRYLAALLRP
jgi:flavin-dependent dehydrogenase